jgi:hypothetical protein
MAFKYLGYSRRIAKKKGFLEDPKVIVERLAFARKGMQWTRECLYY